MTEERWTSDELYVRSRRGDGGRGYPRYGGSTGYIEPMVAPQARATTLRLVPRSEAGA